jgi:lactate dehydrogenase-like 2-hydroxyacid dehydrogenase
MKLCGTMNPTILEIKNLVVTVRCRVIKYTMITNQIHSRHWHQCRPIENAQYPLTHRLTRMPDMKKAVVIGVGNVGQLVIERLKILGFDVIMCDPLRAEQEADFILLFWMILHDLLLDFFPFLKFTRSYFKSSDIPFVQAHYFCFYDLK